jgi:hypothetical protein
MNDTNNERRPVSGLGFGHNAREIDDVKPAPEPAPAAPSAAPMFRPARPLTPSGTPGERLLPAFRGVSANLTRELAANDAIRLHGVRDLVPGAADVNPRETLAQLAKGIASSEISNAEAETLFNALHPGVDPNGVK